MIGGVIIDEKDSTCGDGTRFEDEHDFIFATAGKRLAR